MLFLSKNQATSARRRTGTALIAAATLGLAATATVAQDYPGAAPGYDIGERYYVDGSAPVSNKTRDEVDAYLGRLREKRLAREEYNNRLNYFFAHDLITRGRPDGRF
ncbi:MAG TPA: hypothetical protein ENK41_03670 [Rhodobacteraceae bacterium]|nr:hypothetical protein [Paracoccaceae bacterium]